MKQVDRPKAVRLKEMLPRRTFGPCMFLKAFSLTTFSLIFHWSPRDSLFARSNRIEAKKKAEATMIMAAPEVRFRM